jgi:solute carrier family 25 carnitine/acylcarnitine transporter 20/29
MFKVRMQGQYGSATDKRLRDVAKEMWRDWGFRKGVMRGYWVFTYIVVLTEFG